MWWESSRERRGSVGLLTQAMKVLVESCPRGRHLGKSSALRCEQYLLLLVRPRPHTDRR